MEMFTLDASNIKRIARMHARVQCELGLAFSHQTGAHAAGIDDGINLFFLARLLQEGIAARHLC